MALSLYIYSSSSSSKGNALDLTKEDVSLERTFNEKDSDNNDVKYTYSYPVSLTHVDYEKKIYEPCVINAIATVGCGTKQKEGDTSIISSTTLPTHSELVKFFSRMKVELDMDGTAIAENYFVFKVRTMRQKVSSSFVTVELEIYSEDKLLTLEKYSKAYTAKKLGTDIFMKEIVKYDITNTPDEQAYTVNLQMLAYDTDEKDNDGQVIKNELRQPYLVQYNETFYDFLRRTANRCGEFLYFENGKLNLGLTKVDKTSADYLNDAANYNFDSLYGNSVFAEGTEVEYYNYNYLKNEKDDSTHHAESGKYHYSDPLAADEYLDSIGKSYTSWADEQDFRKDAMMHLIKVLSGTSLGQIITNAVLTVAEHNKEVLYDMWTKNADYKEENIEAYEDKDDLKDQWNSDEDMLSQFSTASNQKTSDISSDAINMNADFYSLIRQAEKTIGEVGEEALFIDFGSSHKSLSLGDIIKGEDRQYLVVQIKGSCEYKAKEESAPTKELVSTQHVVAIPLYEVTTDSTTNYIPIPPALPQVCVRESQSQLAFITHNNDPRKIGRVRVRFAWQEKGDDPSPWVRVSMPFATDGGGVKFMPEVDNEVLVSFEEGNVERPYVSGYLLSERSNQSWGYLPDRTIQSANGHGITFDDKTSVGFFTNLVPAFDFVTSFVPEFAWPSFMEEKHVAALAGGMSLRDQYGLYEISMSSDQRSISIQSSMGNVELNAFTGITISAPNGDIKIEGKNVEIEASNTVKITSGKALEDRYVSFLAPLKETLSEWVVEKLLDLTLIRSLVEAVLRPIDGTTTIKSFTFVQIEAGKGSVDFPVEASSHQKAAPQKLTRSIDCIKTAIEGFAGQINTSAETLSQNLKTLEDMSGTGNDMVNKEEKVIKISDIIDKIKGNQAIQDTDYKWDQNKLQDETFDENSVLEDVKKATKLNAKPEETGNDANNVPYQCPDPNDNKKKITTDQFEKDSKLWKDTYDKFVKDGEAAVKKANEEKKKKREELTNCVTALVTQYKNVAKLITDFEKKGLNLTAPAAEIYSDKASSALKSVDDIIKLDDSKMYKALKEYTFKKSSDLELLNETCKKIWCRRALCAFLGNVMVDFNKELEVDDAIKAAPAKPNNFADDQEWASFIDAILNEGATPTPKTVSKFAKAMKPFKDWFMENFLDAWIDTFYNRKRWATGAEGKILMSDSPSNTIHINKNGTVESFANLTVSGKYVRNIKNELKGM